MNLNTPENCYFATYLMYMQDSIRVSSALISVFDKKGLDPIVERPKLGVTIYSTGGTADYIDSLGVEVIRVESITTILQS